jgi:hypothetical protein
LEVTENRLQELVQAVEHYQEQLEQSIPGSLCRFDGELNVVRMQGISFYLNRHIAYYLMKSVGQATWGESFSYIPNTEDPTPESQSNIPHQLKRAAA